VTQPRTQSSQAGPVTPSVTESRVGSFGSGTPCASPSGGISVSPRRLLQTAVRRGSTGARRGPAVFLPLHAVGRHGEAGPQAVIDRAESVYIARLRTASSYVRAGPAGRLWSSRVQLARGHNGPPQRRIQRRSPIGRPLPLQPGGTAASGPVQDISQGVQTGACDGGLGCRSEFESHVDELLPPGRRGRTAQPLPAPRRRGTLTDPWPINCLCCQESLCVHQKQC
jgi:hypothetical protein